MPTATGIVLLDGRLDNTEELIKSLSSMQVNPRGPAHLIACLANEGRRFLPTLKGNFAMVIVNIREASMLLVRDRFGTKPLTYAQIDGYGWCCASEAKMLLPLLDQPKIERAALPEVVYYRWLVGDLTLVEGIKQVLPASAVTLENGREPEVSAYWRLRFEPRAEVAPRETGNPPRP
jgi:asparagine synthase (glutamine-hydrolysing)